MNSDDPLTVTLTRSEWGEVMFALRQTCKKRRLNIEKPAFDASLAPNAPIALGRTEKHCVGADGKALRGIQRAMR